MESYKKKSLKFSGLGRDIRAAELNAARGSSRLQRFSLLRPIDVLNEDPKENIPTSRIPTCGNQKSQTISRAEMLKKWKNEKLLKKKIELESKKPVFKTGLAPLKLEPSPVSSNKCNRFGHLSRIQGSDTSNLKPPKVSDAKGSIKIPFSGVSKPIIQKPVLPSLLLPRKQQIPKSAKPTVQKPTVPSLLPQRKQQISNIKPKGQMPANRSNPQTSTTKPMGPTPANRSNPQTSTTKPMGPTPANRSNPQTSTTKPMGPTPANRSNPQTSTTKPMGPTPANRSNPQNQPSKMIKPVFKSSNPVVKSANPAQAKQLGTTFRKPAEKSIPRKLQPKKIVDKSSTSKSQNSMFPCHLSLIQPVEKSFAPEGFEFNTTFLKTLSEDGPLEIFARVKEEMEGKIRTSTPKRSDWNECQDQKDGSYITTTSFTIENSTVPTSEKMHSSSVSSDMECLLDNSPLDVKSSVPVSPKNELLDQAQAPKILTMKENPEEIHPEVGHLETGQPRLISPEAVPLEIMHLQHDAVETDMKPEQVIASLIASSDTKDCGIISAEIDSEQARLCQSGSPEICLPVPNETKGFASTLCLPKDDPTKIPDLCLLGMDQEKNTASEKFGKRFTRSRRRIGKPSLLEISESPENREMPKAHQKSSACAEFTTTPRRSMRLARLSQFNSIENLFDVKPFFSSPCKESSRLTEDFKNLNLESLGDATEEPRMSTRSSSAHNSRVSLLYTPPRRRASTRNKLSLAGDLIQFTPDA